MCGIVGLFIKNPTLEGQLGALLSPMMVEMTERGPDSAGVAVYRNGLAEGSSKITVVSAGGDVPWGSLRNELEAAFGHAATLQSRASHAVITVPDTATAALDWLGREHPELSVTSSGTHIEIFKEMGLVKDVIEQLEIDQIGGTHALGHTRLATESAVTREHSHPFSTGLDLCLVHNGSLSNHNRLRRFLRRQGIEFRTDNDSEVAAGYLTWRLQQGDDLDQALNNALDDLDGFYTFVVGTRDGFAVLRDPIGCKPAVMAETDDWAAIASEFRAIAGLPGVENAAIWEPTPAKIYSWKRSDAHA